MLHVFSGLPYLPLKLLRINFFREVIVLNLCGCECVCVCVCVCVCMKDISIAKKLVRNNALK